MNGPPDFLLEWARRSGPRRVLDEARARLESGRLGVRANLALELTDAERREVGRLLPASWAASGDPVRTRALRAGLAEHGTTLEGLLEATGGALRDLREERATIRAACTDERAEALRVLREALGEAPESAEGAATHLLNRWVLRRVPPLERARDVLRVVGALPVEGDVRLAVLAAGLFDDAHALDRSRRLGRAVARFLALRAALAARAEHSGEQEMASSSVPAGESPEPGEAPEELLGWSDPLGSAEAWRAAWASGGVTCDGVSAQVLVLNLPLTGDAPAVALCAATPGEPVWLTLRSLVGAFGLGWPSEVFVCENPSIVEEAASRLGATSRPLVCTFGRPSSAAWTLLRGIVPHARLHVRADGDAVGRGIVSTLLDEFPAAMPWRMPGDSTAYEEKLIEELLIDLGSPIVGS